MSRYEAPKVYKDTLDLLIAISKLKEIPRNVRFTDMESLKKELAATLLCIFNANKTRDKAPFLDKAIDHVCNSKIWLRLMQEQYAISRERYAVLSHSLVCISKQLTGWKKTETNHKDQAL